MCCGWSYRIKWEARSSGRPASGLRGIQSSGKRGRVLSQGHGWWSGDTQGSIDLGLLRDRTDREEGWGA